MAVSKKTKPKPAATTKKSAKKKATAKDRHSPSTYGFFLRLEEDLYLAVRDTAEDEERTMAAIVRRALREHLGVE